MMKRPGSSVLPLLFGALAPSDISAQAFDGPPVWSPERTAAVALRETISVYELAAKWAPILWFSDYEPLLATTPRGELPSVMPTDGVPQPAGKGVVYYRATVVTPRNGTTFAASWDLETEDTPNSLYTPFPECSVADTPDNPDPTPDCLHLAEIGLIRLQYLFYFKEDVGGGGHKHDLEIAELWFNVSDLENGTHRVELVWIVGYAHGHKGFANKLDLTAGNPIDPLSIPLVFFIERGKHAPAPDRTFDGEFTPGFDVNEMVGDAWGIRDVFTSKWFGGRSYSSWMTLGRTDEQMAIFGGGSTDAHNSWAYELRDFKPAATQLPASPDLLVYLEYHDYDGEPQNGPDRFWGLRQYFGVGARFDLGLGPYVSWMGPNLPFIGGHPVVTATGGITYVGNGAWWGLSAFYSPSISGLFNIYGGATWLKCSTCTTGTGFGPEAGLKLRIPIPHPPRPDFVGVRIGLRYSKFTQLGSPRFLVEVGLATP